MSIKSSKILYWKVHSWEVSVEARGNFWSKMVNTLVEAEIHWSKFEASLKFFIGQKLSNFRPSYMFRLNYLSLTLPIFK